MKRILKAFSYFLATSALFAAQASFAYANTPPIDASYNNRIIDDAVFSSTSTMGVIDIQNFLNAKVPSCDSWHVDPATGQPPSSPWICLKDYVDPTTGKSSAQLIYDEAQSRGLNPEVILVTLQKEQSLVTDTWPYPSQYKSAMGYGCPESQSVCDAQYYGFYNQVHLGSTLLRVGMDRDCGNTSSFPGWSVNSQWRLGNSPAVDGVPTYLASCATGSLYNYTPHRPDSAYTARNGTYYYGNYNFVSFFTSWFGPTQLASIARSTNSPQIYLINGSLKYPINTADVLDAFRYFGVVHYVAQSYLDGLSTGAAMGHIGRDPSSGAIYLLDSGNRIQFSDCSMVAAWGYGDSSCNGMSYVDLPTNVLNGFVPGGSISNVAKAASGSTIYEVQSGQRHIVPDWDTYTASGLSSQQVTGVADYTINTLPYGNPILREQVVAINSDNGQAFIYMNGNLDLIPNATLYTNWRFNGRPTYRFPGWMLGFPRGADITTFTQDSSGNKYLMNGGSKLPLGGDASQWSASYAAMPDNLISAVPTGSQPSRLVKGAGPQVYWIEAATKRLLASADDLIRADFNPNGPAVFSAIQTIDDSNISSVPSGYTKFGTLRLLKTSSSPNVVMVNGSNSVYVPSSLMASAFGLDLSSAWTVDQNTFNYYSSNATLQALFTDGTIWYLADSGAKHSIDSNTAAAYGYSGPSFMALSPSVAAYTPNGAYMSRYLHGSGSTIYYINNGQKQPFASYQAYANAGGNPNNTFTVSDSYLSTLPTGSPVY